MLDRGSQVAGHAGRNPKTEIRKPKEIRKAKSESGLGSPHAGRPPEGYPHLTLLANSAPHVCLEPNSAFGFRPSFGFRISGFGFGPATGSASTRLSKECHTYVA
jgi:hypothetical protein